MTQHFLNDTAVTTASDKVFVDMRREIVLFERFGAKR